MAACLNGAGFVTGMTASKFIKASLADRGDAISQARKWLLKIHFVN
jgi:hypothetical protein